MREPIQALSLRSNHVDIGIYKQVDKFVEQTPGLSSFRSDLVNLIFTSRSLPLHHLSKSLRIMKSFLILSTITATSAFRVPYGASLEFPGHVCRDKRSGKIFALSSAQLQKELDQATLVDTDLWSAPVYRHSDMQVEFEYKLDTNSPTLSSPRKLVLMDIQYTNVGPTRPPRTMANGIRAGARKGLFGDEFYSWTNAVIFAYMTISMDIVDKHRIIIFPF